MKYGNTFFAETSREIWNKEISDKAKFLYFWLKELGQRYCGYNSDTFYRSDEQLAKDLHWGESTVKKAKKELIASNVIQIGYVHWWVDDEHTKKSKKKVTNYRILI